MTKAYPLHLSKDQVDKILNEALKKNEFDYMLFLTLKTTGRRIGELYGVQQKKEIGRKIVGKKVIYYKGKPREIDKTIPVYKKGKKWLGGVRVKDIDFDKGTMKVWVLKRGNYVKDETILLPETMRVIKQYISRNRLTLKNRVFRKKGRGMRQIQNIIKYYGEKAGIPTAVKEDGISYSLSVHSLRHYFITELKRKGWNDDKIIKLTGHKTTNTLRNYDHIIATDLKDEALESLKDI